MIMLDSAYEPPPSGLDWVDEEFKHAIELRSNPIDEEQVVSDAQRLYRADLTKAGVPADKIDKMIEQW